MTMRQLAFDLPHRPALGREDFFVSAANADAVALVDRWPDWPHHAVIVTGPQGSGKSHLAAVWTHASGAEHVAAAALGARHVDLAQSGRPLAVEDGDAGPFDEALLFHLLNAARQAGTFLLLTGTRPPARWPVALPDLVSRLRAAPHAGLGAPDDALLRAVLVKLLSDRQLAVEPAVLDYVLRRMRRSLDHARRLVDALDRRALAERRAITRALAADVLAALEGEGGA